LHRLGLLPSFQLGFKDPGVKRILKMMLPALFGVSVTQINLLLDTLIASFLVAGSVSWLYYSDRLVEFPLGIFGIALATVILPNLSKNHAANDPVEFSKSMDWALRLVLLIGLPASVGLLILAEPMLSTLFQYEEFGRHDVELAGQSLMAYAIGLLGFILVKVLVPGFTSRKDMKTPVRFGIYAMFANMGLNIVLVFPLEHAGLALATSLGAFLNAALLLTRLLKDKIYRPGKNWANFIVKIIFANEIMALFLFSCVEREEWFVWTAFEKVYHLGLWVAAGGLVYILSLCLIGLRPNQIFSKY
jgi:putative peptidoglycan lipid II flippase